MEYYKKRLSKDELDRHAILILKSALKFFPDFDTSFTISVPCYGKTFEFESIVEKEYCNCRRDPHYHYYLDFLPAWKCLTLKAGDYIILRKSNEKYFFDNE